jgi:Leucine-rich repeat (LRR) protein
VYLQDDPSECSSLRNLRTLQLNANHIVTPPSTCLSQLSSLQHLGLADNLIAAVTEDAFPPALRDIVSLHLQGNQIANLAPGSFDNLSSLQILDLSDNNLTYVPSIALAKLSRTLVELDLSGNPIVHVGPVAFQSLFELRRLRLSRLTELLRVEQRAFVDNIRLEEIELELCPQLKRIPGRLFHGNPLLTRVSLRGNALQTLNAADLPLGQLRIIALADNPLRCNCSLLWLWRLARDAAV